MTTAKKENYTEAQVKELSDAYTEVETEAERDEVIEKFSQKFNKTKRSIIAKLSKEGIYIKKETSKKTGAIVIKKEDLESRIIEAANETGRNGAKLVGISKAPKTAMFEVLNMIQELDALWEMVEDSQDNESEENESVAA